MKKYFNRFKEWGDDDDDDGPNPALFTGIHPDTLYNEDPQSITFIYSPKLKKLWASHYPVTHWQILQQQGVGQLVNPNDPPQDRNQAISSGLLLGRIGRFHGTKVISYWDVPPENEVQESLRAIAQKIPSAAKYPDQTIVISAKQSGTGGVSSGGFSSGWYPQPLSKFVPDIQQSLGSEDQIDNQELAKDNNEECNSLGVTVQGRFMKLTELVGNLHMVKGTNLELMKSAFCDSYQELKQRAEKMGCHGAIALIEHIASRVECSKMGVTPQEKYNNAKKVGSAALRSDYGKLFSHPDRIDAEFRGRQKDIDSAWDYYMKGRNETFTGFKQWLTLDEGKRNEKQRRRSNRKHKTRHLFNW